MHRFLTYVLGPETVVVAFNLAVFAFCARHASGEGRDLQLMERGSMLLPPLVVVAVFLTAMVPGVLHWGWLARAITASFLGSAVLAWRLIEGFGTGARGQDAAYILALCSTGMMTGLGTAIVGTLILCRSHPGFATWFQARPIIGWVLTLVSAIPIGLGLLLVAAFTGGIALGVISAFRR